MYIYHRFTDILPLYNRASSALFDVYNNIDIKAIETDLRSVIGKEKHMLPSSFICILNKNI